MKFIVVVLLCLSFFLGADAQADEKGNEKSEEVKTTKLVLARKDYEGNIIEGVDIFSPKDIPIICYVDLASAKPVMVKLNFIAVKVKGLRPKSKIISVSYKTKDGEDSVTFTGRPEKIWFIGTYRVDILLDGKLAFSRSFRVAKSRAKPRK